MSTWLLDTNVVSELRRAAPSRKVLDFLRSKALTSLYVSAVTLAELRSGIERVSATKKRAELHEWLEHIVRPMFEQRVVPIHEDVMLRWRILVEEGRKDGYTYSQPDLIIAATGLHFGMTVVTRNTSDFERSGVPFLNPWKAA